MNASGRTRCRDPDTGNSKGMVIGSLPAVPPPMIGVRAQASPQQINTGIKRDKEFIILNKLQFVSDGLSKIV
ncbi:unnamed protein product [Rhizophagus irregularis]|nr:unnamed protein product [Rhizophagus irregularis]